MKQVITAQDIADARKNLTVSIDVPPGVLVTPQAFDDARAYGISLRHTAVNGPACAPGMAAASTLQTAPVLQPALAPASVSIASATPAGGRAAASPAPSSAGTAQAPLYCTREAQAVQQLVSSIGGFGQSPAPQQTAAIPCPSVDALHSVVRSVLLQRLGSGVDAAALDRVIAEVIAATCPSPASAPVTSGAASGAASPSPAPGTHSASGGAMLARAPEEFRKMQGNTANDSVLLTDALPADENGPGVGFMVFTDTSFEWTFPGSEVLVVQEGSLSISGGNGTVLTANAGDAVRVPAGTPLTLTAKGCVRCVYSAWPK